jgi:hypothetical protein|tara:strand:+ start:1142 stop:1357 length:216 start_codon:yes stop_codon:yes gene_type:complete
MWSSAPSSVIAGIYPAADGIIRYPNVDVYSSDIRIKENAVPDGLYLSKIKAYGIQQYTEEYVPNSYRVWIV